MKRIEAWGAELAMAMRREGDAQAALLLAEKEAERLVREAAQHVQDCGEAVLNIQKRILTATADELYMSTGEWASLPAVRNADTEVITVDQDQQCPGSECAWYGQGAQHMHGRDGRVYGLKIPGIPSDWVS